MDFGDVFEELKTTMLACADELDCKIHRNDELQVYTRHLMKNGKPLWFGKADAGQVLFQLFVHRTIALR